MILDTFFKIYTHVQLFLPSLLQSLWSTLKSSFTISKYPFAAMWIGLKPSSFTCLTKYGFTESPWQSPRGRPWKRHVRDYVMKKEQECGVWEGSLQAIGIKTWYFLFEKPPVALCTLCYVNNYVFFTWYVVVIVLGTWDMFWLVRKLNEIGYRRRNINQLINLY